MKEIFKFHYEDKRIIFESVNEMFSRWLVIRECTLDSRRFFSVVIFIPSRFGICRVRSDFIYTVLSTFDNLASAYTFAKQIFSNSDYILLDKVSEKCYTK